MTSSVPPGQLRNLARLSIKVQKRAGETAPCRGPGLVPSAAKRKKRKGKDILVKEICEVLQYGLLTASHWTWKVSEAEDMALPIPSHISVVCLWSPPGWCFQQPWWQQAAGSGPLSASSLSRPQKVQLGPLARLLG